MKPNVGITSVFRRYCVGGLAAALVSGCAPFPSPTVSYRDLTVPIASTTRFEESRFAGTWHRIAVFSEDETGVTPSGTWEFEARDGQQIAIAKCCMTPNPPQPYIEVATARFEPDTHMLKNQPPVWVLWVDEGYRTAVVGTPDGSFGEVLNRTPDIATDRMHAAREVLDFNGYDLSQMRVKK